MPVLPTFVNSLACKLCFDCDIVHVNSYHFSKVNYWNIDFPQILFKFQLHLVPEI